MATAAASPCQRGLADLREGDAEANGPVVRDDAVDKVAHAIARDLLAFASDNHGVFEIRVRESVRVA